MSVEEKNAMVDRLMEKLTLSNVQSHIKDFVSDTLIIGCKTLSKSVQSNLLHKVSAIVKKDPGNSF